MARAHQKRRCRGTSSRTGKRCKAWAIKGGTVCVAHGAAAPQVKRKAAERLALVEAQRMVARAGVSMDPIEHLLDSLHRAAQLEAVFGAMVAAIDERAEEEAKLNDALRGELGYLEASVDSEDELIVLSRDRLLALNRHGEAQLHPYVQEYGRWFDRRSKVAKLCLDARIDERVIALHERQVKLAQDAFEAALEVLKLSKPQRQEARRAYAGSLRAA